jgi:hypothetical protein
MLISLVLLSPVTLVDAAAGAPGGGQSVTHDSSLDGARASDTAAAGAASAAAAPWQTAIAGAGGSASWREAAAAAAAGLGRAAAAPSVTRTPAI